MTQPNDIEQDVADRGTAAPAASQNHLWLVENWFGKKRWYREATHFACALEKQFQGRVGWQEGELHVERQGGPIETHYYAHDMRVVPWKQHRYQDEHRRDEGVITKEIKRVSETNQFGIPGMTPVRQDNK